MDKFFDKPEEGRYQVVGDLNIKVRENEFLVLFGPGQCGKSTILNLIAGFEMPSSGHVLCMGKDITGPRSGSRHGLSEYGIVSVAHRYGKRGIRS